MRIVFDIETDGLIDTVTKIHCLCAYNMDTSKSIELTSHDKMKELFSVGEHRDITLVGHNIIRFDIPVLEKVLGIDLSKTRKIDTLGLSWYLYPTRTSHNLEDWGNEFGVTKPEVEDWQGLTTAVYVNRCSQDVRINTRLFNAQLGYLFDLYGKEGKATRIMGYITYKLECAREQEEVKWRVDVKKCMEGVEYLGKEKEEKASLLSDIMPEVVKYKIVEKPEKMRKINGDLTERAKTWYHILATMGLPDYYLGSVQVEVSRDKGNPRSHQQVKEWLFSLGWNPETFKYVKDDSGGFRKIPQISLLDNSDICPSVKALYEVEPRLKTIEGFFVINHRVDLLEGFLEKMDKDGFVKAEIQGLANTLRFQHVKPCVNLPTVVKPYGELVRGVLIAPDEDHVLCGSDCTGLEEATKHHYMMLYDPAYVQELRTPDFDPHMDLAKLAGMVTSADVAFYKAYDRDTASNGDKERYKKLKDIRTNKGKKTNFAAIYGAGPPKIAVTLNVPLSEAKALYKVYWKRNRAVRIIAENCIVKNVNGQMWLYNPVSQFWYSLRFDKDRFSTLNQGTAVYCFDTWVRKVRNKGFRLCGQFHDELITPIWKNQTLKTKDSLIEAMNETNDELKLRVTLGIDTHFGHSYADIH